MAALEHSLSDHETERVAAGDMPGTDLPIGRLSNSTNTRYPRVQDDSVKTLAYRAPQRASTWVLRPSLFVRILLAALVALLGLLALLSAFLAQAVTQMVGGIRTDDRLMPRMVVEESLPGASFLADDLHFSQIVGERPELRAELELARASALMDRDRRVEAVDILLDLGATERWQELSIQRQIRLAELLVEARQPEAANRLLAAFPLTGFPQEDRARALALLGRLRLAGIR